VLSSEHVQATLAKRLHDERAALEAQVEAELAQEAAGREAARLEKEEELRQKEEELRQIEARRRQEVRGARGGLPGVWVGRIEHSSWLLHRQPVLQATVQPTNPNRHSQPTPTVTCQEEEAEKRAADAERAAHASRLTELQRQLESKKKEEAR
jgi:hypothetical protein